ncbi:MAG TPA: hypothetical protein VM182_10005 [Terriglobia bacterium]|nr:hypothetical protein [Terriglobia bacterium]
MKAERLGSKVCRREGVCVLAVGLCLLAVVPALPQATANKPGEPAESADARPAATSTEKKPKLAEITRVSTDEAARGAAREKATPDEDASIVETDEAAEPAVTELKPTVKSSGESRGSVTIEDSKGSRASKVHGRAYGSLDPESSGDRQEGAAVGAGSKSGKTNIYIETERSRRTSPPNR